MAATASGARGGAGEVCVEPDAAGQRIDNFLFSRLKGIPRSRIYRALRNGEVRVNGSRARPTRKLAAGDRVRVPPLRVAEGSAPVAPGRGLRERIESGILFEDEGLLVLDKPSGVAVHGGSGQSLGVIEALRSLRPEARMLELVHRLDRDTSGCLLVAKKRAVLLSLHAQLRANTVHKRYLALLEGRCRRDPFVVDEPLRKNTLRSGERVVTRDVEGKRARTRFEPLARGEEASLVAALPETGRTHQIRVHAALAGHPIAGDAKYGRREFDARARELGSKRLFLHCESMAVDYPAGERCTFVAPLPPDLVAVARRFGLDTGAVRREAAGDRDGGAGAAPGNRHRGASA